MIKLSVNINKIATVRNSRGGNLPDVTKAAVDCVNFGADGITVHPRPDARHIRYDDVRSIKSVLTEELNIEGNPTAGFINLVTSVVPAQVTLVPDAPDAITSNAGWDTVSNREFLTDICKEFKSAGIRTSIFVEADPAAVEAAAVCGADRVELYTESYARLFPENPQKAVAPYYRAARVARDCGLEINAGHDLNLENLHYFVQTIPWLSEVSIGHAIICDALYMGLKKTIEAYRNEIRKF